MTAGLETFAKVRALHDRTDSPGEKSAAAGRMEALARSAGMSVAEALSKLDAEPSYPDLAAAARAWAERYEAAHSAAAKAANAPDARSRRYGLPIYDPNKIEHWWTVAQHCLQLDWMIPKACGGKFLTKDQRARLKAVAQYGAVTNATADWIESVLAQCQAVRNVWLDRGKGGTRPDPKDTKSDIEKAAEMVAAAERREASKMDTLEPELEPEPQSQAQTAADSFNAFFNSPDMLAQRAEREARRRIEAAAIVARYGSEDAVFEDTAIEAALRSACEPLLGAGETWNSSYSLDGWGSLGTRHVMPASVREAVSQGWPLPTTVAEAWAEYEAADRLTGERCTVEYRYEPHLFVEARRYLVEEICNTLPARSLNDLRARGAWLAFHAASEVEQNADDHRTLIATLRADIERMGARLREQEAEPVQTGQAQRGNETAPHPHASDLKGEPSPVQSGYPRRTNAEKRAAVLALFGHGLTDREIARRAGVSPQTVGNIRKAQP